MNLQPQQKAKTSVIDPRNKLQENGLTDSGFLKSCAEKRTSVCHYMFNRHVQIHILFPRPNNQNDFCLAFFIGIEPDAISTLPNICEVVITWEMHYLFPKPYCKFVLNQLDH